MQKMYFLEMNQVSKKKPGKWEDEKEREKRRVPNRKK